MADVKNGGGYGRFYELESTSGSTTATNKSSNTLNSGGAVAGITNSTADLEKLKKSIISNSTSMGKNITNQVSGVVQSSTGPTANQSSLNLKDAFNFQTRVKADIKPPLPNILSYYSSFNYIFTLSILTQEAVNFPDQTYKKGIYGPLILRSAGGAPDKELVGTQYGKYDFYIDDLNLDSVMGLDKSTGNTNATGFRFTIIEPYSMGLFFQSLQAAALASGYMNYLDVPVLLTIEFKGHVFDNETQLQNVQIDNSTRHFPLKLSDMTMKVTGKGTTYSIEGFPWNEQSFSTEFNQVKSDVQFYCDDKGPFTVQNMLQTGEQSLQYVLNDYLKKRAQEGETPNQILILFPSDKSSDPNVSNVQPNENQDRPAAINPNDNSSKSVLKKLGVTAGTGKNTTLVQATGDSSVNKIGQMLMGFNPYNKGESPFPKDNTVYDPETQTLVRGNMSINLSNCSFKFKQGTSVVDIINRTILLSDYGRNALDTAQRTKTGKITWWRIESQTYLLDDEDNLTTGVKPKLIVYRVVPYEVDSSYVLPTNTQRPQLENLKKEAIKQYDYIYTGKNTEILDFNIEFNAGFYRALNADGGKNNEGQIVQASTSAAAELSANDQLKRNIISQAVAGSSPTTQATPQKQIRTKTKTKNYNIGGGGPDDATVVAATQFQELITAGVDMINLDLTILGDPYYLGDSGMGNYSAKGVENFSCINADGAVNYQDTQIVVQVNFRTPIDINLDTGFYNFGDTKPVTQFSGLYQLIEVTSTFSRGSFKQVLKMLRIPNQDNPKADQGPQVSTLSNQVKPPTIVETNNNILAAITKKNNNVNTNPPTPTLPGVVDTRGFTI
jgi:hypothetical protein